MKDLRSKDLGLKDLGALARKAMDACAALSQFTEEEGKITRTFLRPPMLRGHAYLRDWMESIGMTVRIDPAGNLRGLSRAAKPGAARLIIASHLDTVPDAGAYDGVLGVVLGIALVEALAQDHRSYDVEVVGFSEEEGVRFGFPFIGSKALVGELTTEDLSRNDVDGTTVADAIRRYGLDPTRLFEAKEEAAVRAYLEFHIEQGPQLDSQGAGLAIVSAIVGQSRWELSFVGKAGHAGTTPMDLRRDALAGAAEWLTEVEKTAIREPGLTATVGRIAATPGATNVIAGSSTASLDVRHAEDDIRHGAVERILDAAREIAARRGLRVTARRQMEQNTVPLDADVRERLRRAFAQCGRPPIELVSGAGHDAMIVAPHYPSGMVFLRSPDGISHHPSESVLLEDVEAALEVGLAFLRDFEFESSIA